MINLIIRITFELWNSLKITDKQERNSL